jgi:hypothetical protein
MIKLNSTLAEQASNNNGPKGAKAKEIFLGSQSPSSGPPILTKSSPPLRAVTKC